MKETMKWLRVSLALLVAVVMSCGLVACGDDDDDNGGGKGTAGSLVGTWRAVYIFEDGSDVEGITIEFKADGTVINKDVSEVMNITYGKWSTRGNVLTIAWQDRYEDEGTYVCKFSVSGDTLKLWGDNEDEYDLYTRVK